MSKKRNTQSARRAVHDVLVTQAAAFPMMPAEKAPTQYLPPQEIRLATALHRTVLQHWLTLEHILNHFLSKSLRKLEPKMQAVLLSGAAQILFMDRIPSHAAVDESVHLAHRLIRPGAAKLTNAILRRISEINTTFYDEPWYPHSQHIPHHAGYITVPQDILPHIDNLPRYLSIATSHPQPLIESWRSQYNDEQLISLLTHSHVSPPVIVHSQQPAAADHPDLTPHVYPGAYLWQGRTSELTDCLTQLSDAFVQDPTAAKVPRVTEPYKYNLMVDYCAGRGTKTRHFATLHPEATIIATDIVADRCHDLAEVFKDAPKVKVIPFDELVQYRNQADLVFLDVPCSNTGVLPRRPEARYRFSPNQMDEITTLQKQIITSAHKLLKNETTPESPAQILYSTCSIEAPENQRITQWIKSEYKMKIAHEESTLPAGHSETYHDGGYYALLST